MNTPKQNSALLVLGMHRSGTSALAGVLSSAGADPGPLLIPGVAGINPKGFWEHQNIVEVHERLLASLNSSWDDECSLPMNWWRQPGIADFSNELLAILRRDFTNRPLWLLKDPRLCRLLPLWQEILQRFEVNPNFVICLRHPYEVAQSLKQRNNTPAARSNLLWLEHLLSSVRDTRGFPRIVVTYEQLLADWRIVIQNIATTLSLDLSVNGEAAARISDFLEPKLRHHKNAVPASDADRLSLLAVSAYDIAVSAGPAQIDAALVEIAQEVGLISTMIRPWASHAHDIDVMNRRVTAQNIELSNTNTSLQAELTRVKSSISWRITAPIRVGWNLVRKLVAVVAK